MRVGYEFFKLAVDGIGEKMLRSKSIEPNDHIDALHDLIVDYFCRAFNVPREKIMPFYQVACQNAMDAGATAKNSLASEDADSSSAVEKSEMIDEMPITAPNC